MFDAIALRCGGALSAWETFCLIIGPFLGTHRAMTSSHVSGLAMMSRVVRPASRACMGRKLSDARALKFSLAARRIFFQLKCEMSQTKSTNNRGRLHRVVKVAEGDEHASSHDLRRHGEVRSIAVNARPAI